MNKRLDYRFKAMVLRMLLLIAIKVVGNAVLEFESQVREVAYECEAISDGRSE